MDLADGAHGLQVPGKIGPAHGGADAPAVGGQRAHGMAADESPTPPNTVTRLPCSSREIMAPRLARCRRLPSNTPQGASVKRKGAAGDMAFARRAVG